MRISTFIDILSETTNSQPTKNTICQNVNAIHQECISHEHPVYFFSRPRRFGKSLLVSTLEAYFQGKKELFKGLAMEQLEKDWTVYPVLHIDFSLTKYTELTDLTGQLNLFLHRWEKIYGKDEVETTSAERLQGIILRAHKQTGTPIAVLIDEYDAPLLDSNFDIQSANEVLFRLRRDGLTDGSSRVHLLLHSLPNRHNKQFHPLCYAQSLQFYS